MTRPSAPAGSQGMQPVDSPAGRARHAGRRRLRVVLRGAVLAAVLLLIDLSAPLSRVPALPGYADPPVTAAVPAQVGVCVAGWQEVAIPDTAFISTPFDIVTRQDEVAWILGGANDGILALRWDGTSWRRVAGVTRGHRGLVGGDAIGDRDVLAVGYYRPLTADEAGSLEPIGGVVTGATWKGRDVPVPPGPRATLTDVVSLGRDAAWAVGTRLDGGRLRAYAVRWDGRDWERREPPTKGGSGLVAIARSGSVTMAVGWQEAGPGRPRPYAARLDGGRWRPMALSGLPRGTAVLTDIELASAREGWAVGYHAARRSDRHIAFLLRWDGRRWSREPLPWADEVAAVPRSVSVGSDGRLWIAGAQPADDQREVRGFIAHRDAGTWQVDVLGVPADVRSEVMDVAATRSGAMAAANVGASLLVLRTCQASATPASRAAGVARIKVGQMKARRKARADEDATAYFEGQAATARPITLAALGRARRLPTPVTPRGFTIQDVTGPSGLAQWTPTFGGFAADLDGNGYRDVVYSRHGDLPPRLAMGGPGGFADAPTDAFSPVDRHGCDGADVDLDGHLDILCAIGASRGKSVKRHELSLAPVGSSRGLARGGRGISDPLGRGRDVGFIHLDGDPYPEVFITSAPDREDGLPSYNRFYRNVGGTLVPAPGVGLDSSHGAECLETGDLDHDGDEDLAYCAAYDFGGRSAGLRLMRNEGGRLRDRTASLGLRPIGDIDVVFADVTGDGRRDVIQLARDRLRISRANGDRYRAVFEARLTDAVALGLGDASGDGVADIYVVRGDGRANKPDLLLVSQDGARRLVSVLIPQTAKGSADDVIALDFDQNGMTDFVVLNGRRKAGPVQLLAAYPG